ncbi:MAG TPA: DUF1553 domain-containing protein, partial [Verrucomicrobiae bacterium]
AAVADLHRTADDEINKMLSEFRKKAGYYLLFQVYQEGDRKAQTELSRTQKLNRDVNQFANRARRGGERDPVLGPWWEMVREWKKDQKTFPAKAREIATRIAANKPTAGAAAKSKKAGSAPASAAPYNPMVAAMFKANAAPRTIEQVAGYYTALFSSVDAQWQAMLKAAAGRNPSPLGNPYVEQIRNTPLAFTSSATMDVDEMVAALPNNLQNRVRGKANEISKLEMTEPGAPGRATILVDLPKPQDSQVFLRGEPGNRGDVAPRRFLEILSGPNRQPFKLGSGRLELAQAIASKGNPLTARVMVNRVWMHHFGEGIVTTPDDFGTMSDTPTHPEMLDYLASYFMDNGWSVKKLHRLILLSNTYQQTSDNNPRFAQIDPYNRLLWRANIRKLEFEAIRDSLLFIGGKLDLAIGGKPVNIVSEPYSSRRSVYGYIDRAAVPEVMTHFDFATPDMPSGRRYNTIVPQQALFMMNGPQVIEVTRNLIARPEYKAAKTDEARIEALYQVIYQRKPRPEEVKLGVEFVTTRVAPVFTQAAAPEPVVAKKGQMQKKAAPAMKGRAGDIVNRSGTYVARTGLTNWEKYAQALLLANEASYVN